MATTTLKEECVDAIIQALGDVGTSTFTCGGTLSGPTKVWLDFLNKSEEWVANAVLPGLQQSHLQQLLESSTIASFGKGKETVTDKSYRDAYALDPAKFYTSFKLSETNILGDIQLLLAPDSLNVRAELYKMNIYTGPTGCFKAHVDTPRGGNMFGSLVVCLPTQFIGGALVTRHNGEQVTYDWSSPANNPISSIQWAAFFSDVEHEILPVTEGYRVTLTYNLYHSDQFNAVPTVDISTSSFYGKLKAALGHPHFMRYGGILGFSCQHAYAEDPNKFLKGSDRVVLLAAKSLGLEARVKPINNFSQCNEEDKKLFLGKEFGFDDGYIYINEEASDTWESTLKNHDMITDDCSNVTWCHQSFKHFQPGFAAIVFGNDAYVDICYQASGILVDIPKWADRHDGTSTGEERLRAKARAKAKARATEKN